MELISQTRMTAGLFVKAKLDKRRYATGVTVRRAEMNALALHPNAFHGDWNYELSTHEVEYSISIKVLMA